MLRSSRKGLTLIELIVVLAILVIFGILIYTGLSKTGLIGAEVPVKGYVVNKNSFLSDEGRIYRVMIKRHPDNSQFEYTVSKQLFDQLIIDEGYNLTIKGDTRIIKADPPTKD